MDVTWDARKDSENRLQRGIRFDDAQAVLFDPMAFVVEDTDARGEQRYKSIGMDATGRVRVVVYTYRTDQLRLISARKAEPHEVRMYEREKR